MCITMASAVSFYMENCLGHFAKWFPGKAPQLFKYIYIGSLCSVMRKLNLDSTTIQKHRSYTEMSAGRATWYFKTSEFCKLLLWMHFLESNNKDKYFMPINSCCIIFYFSWVFQYLARFFSENMNHMQYESFLRTAQGNSLSGLQVLQGMEIISQKKL